MKETVVTVRDVIRRVIEAAGDGTLSVDVLNALIPKAFPVDALDELFDVLDHEGVVVDFSSLRRNHATSSRSFAVPPRREEAIPVPEVIEREVSQPPAAIDLDQEAALIERIKQGDEAARTLLVESFLPLVHRVARRYRRSGVPLSELVLAGSEGLVEAAHHLDGRPGVPFRVTAQWWIRRRLSKCVAENWQGTRLSPAVSRRLRRLASVTARYRVRRGKDPSPALLSRILRVTIDDVFMLRGLFASPLSLQAPWGMDGEQGILADYLEDPAARDGEMVSDQRVRRQRVADLIRSLGGMESKVLSLRYGLQDGITQSVEEVARATGLDRDLVVEAEKIGLARLRSRLGTESL